MVDLVGRMHRMIQAILPWYHDDEVEARHATAAIVARDAARARGRASRSENAIASYEAAGRRMTRR